MFNIKKSTTYLEAELIFKNGIKDWVSPINDIQEDIFINDKDQVEIKNDYYVYKYSVSDIARVDIVKMIDHEEIEREVIYNFINSI